MVPCRNGRASDEGSALGPAWTWRPPTTILMIIIDDIILYIYISIHHVFHDVILCDIRTYENYKHCSLYIYIYRYIDTYCIIPHHCLEHVSMYETTQQQGLPPALRRLAGSAWPDPAPRSRWGRLPSSPRSTRGWSWQEGDFKKTWNPKLHICQ